MKSPRINDVRDELTFNESDNEEIPESPIKLRKERNNWKEIQHCS